MQHLHGYHIIEEWFAFTLLVLFLAIRPIPPPIHYLSFVVCAQ